MNVSAYLVLVRNERHANDSDMPARVAAALMAASNNLCKNVAAGPDMMCVVCKADPDELCEVLREVTRNASWLVLPVGPAVESCGLPHLYKFLTTPAQ